VFESAAMTHGRQKNSMPAHSSPGLMGAAVKQQKEGRTGVTNGAMVRTSISWDKVVE
jgi:hypothetical protein